MRFYIVLLALSMCAWVAMAGVSGVGNARVNHIGGQAAQVQTVDETGAAPATDDAAPAADTAADPALPDAVINGGTPLAAPAGPRTAAEEKADTVLSCMESCGGAVACQNGCISTGYNVPLNGPIPSVTASVPPPIGATVTATTAASSATASVGSAPNKPQGSGAAGALSSYRMAGAMVVVAIASFFVGL
ncbi:hypothetical protein EC991_003081 [Linnemannia zychae]|nr:hypothetical protein EC991_003081 [Linnemannia zychae]